MHSGQTTITLNAEKCGTDAERALVGLLTGCPFHDVRERLKVAQLRPTRQRLSLGWLLFSKGHRHVSAETLFAEASRARFPVSLATVYNTLHQFTEAGLLREIKVDGARTWFDTDLSEHHHFFLEDDERVMDMPEGMLQLAEHPVVPAGMEISRIEVVVRLKKKADDV